MCHSDIMSSKEYLSSFIEDRLCFGSLMSGSCAIFQEDPSPSNEVVIFIIWKNSIVETLSGSVFGWAAEIGLASLIAVLESRGEAIISTPSSSFKEE